MQDQRIIVAGLRARLVIRKGREHMDLCAPQVAVSPACIARTQRAAPRASSSRASYAGTGGLLPTHNSSGLKFRSTLGNPPIWSECAWLSATTSRWRMPRDHSTGDTTSSPMSKSCDSLLRTAAESAAIHQHGLAVWRDQQQRVSLSHVDRLHQQRIMRMIDRPRHHHNRSRCNHGDPGTRPGTILLQRAFDTLARRAKYDRDTKQNAERCSLQWKRRRNAKIANRHRPKQVHKSHAKVQQHRRHRRRNHGSRSRYQRSNQRQQRAGSMITSSGRISMFTGSANTVMRWK